MRLSGKRFALLFTVLFGPVVLQAENTSQKDLVPVDLYVMSLCPFGVQLENALIPVIKSLEKYVDFKLHFIVNSSTEGQGADQKTVFKSMHGQPELDENVRQLCVKKHSSGKYLDYILERNKDYRNPEWRAAAKTLGLDIEKIGACASGSEGMALIAQNAPAHKARQAFSSPTLDIAGKEYKGARGVKSFTRAVCQAIKDKGMKTPDVCANVEALPDDMAPGGDTCGGGNDSAGGGMPPGDPKLVFNIRVVTEKSCKVCEPTLMDALKRQHPGAKFATIDSESAQGKELIKKHKADTLPLYVIDKAVERDPNFKRLLDSFYRKSDEDYVVRPFTADFYPTVQLKRARVPRHMDIFISPLSPFAVQAESEFVRFLQETGTKDFSFSFHFILQEKVVVNPEVGAVPQENPGVTRSVSMNEVNRRFPGPLISENGDEETKESILQVCLFQKAPVSAFFAYQACRSQNLSDPAQPAKCFEMTEEIKDCMQNGESEKLLRQDARLVKELGLNTSIAILWENRYGPFGWHEVDWRRMIEGK